MIKEFPHHDVPRALRRIADNIEAGEWPGETCTLILDGHNIFSFGKGRIHDDQASSEAVFDLTIGLHRIAHTVCVHLDGGEG